MGDPAGGLDLIEDLLTTWSGRRTGYMCYVPYWLPYSGYRSIKLRSLLEKTKDTQRHESSNTRNNKKKKERETVTRAGVTSE